MSTSIINVPVINVPAVAGAIRECPSIHRLAFYLPGQGESIFAWLHQPLAQRSLDHGVLICPPIGHEQLHSHRSLRHLADAFAQKSIPTVRIDWHGTGDSPGSDTDPRRIATWLENIHDAIDWMRNELGCRRVTVVGLRIGATLATLAASKGDIDHLILWSPVSKGRAYVREMKALSLTSAAPMRTPLQPTDDLEAGGFLLNAETVEQLSGIHLIQTRPDCHRILVVSRNSLQEDDQLCSQWAKLGLHVRQIASNGYAEMMAEPHRSEVPHQAIHRMTDWLSDLISSEAQHNDPKESIDCQQSVFISTPAPDAVSVNKLRESTCWIERHPRLFGIVTEPETPIADGRPMIVILNAGSAHRVAPSRLNTLLARRLAAEGFRCLRMDLSGLGDSVQETDEKENDSYPATAFRDIEIALRQVQQRFGAQRIVLMGLCSGAYAAFQSAAQITDPALVESVLINPLTYFWKEGMTLEASPTKHLMSFLYYRKRLLNPRSWFRLLTGKSRLGVRGAIEIFMQTYGRSVNVSRNSATAIKSSQTRGYRSHPEKDDLPGDLKKIVGFNRQLTMFLSKDDPGFGILIHHAKRKTRELLATGRLTLSFIEDADHTFSRNAVRQELIESIAQHFTQRYS